MELETGLMIITLIHLLGATLNGALGYGFSSTTVPVALLFFTNRILNPALVLIEVVINIYVVFINRKSIAHVWKKVLPVLIGLIPLLVSSLAYGVLVVVVLVDFYLLYHYFTQQTLMIYKHQELRASS